MRFMVLVKSNPEAEAGVLPTEKELSEMGAGYSILAVDSKAEALEWTKRFVQVDAGVRPRGEANCELRQIFELEDFPVSPEEKSGSWRDQEQKFRDDLSR